MSTVSTVRSVLPDPEQVRRDLIRPLIQTSWKFYLLVAVLGAMVVAALAAWATQMTLGFGISGITWPI